MHDLIGGELKVCDADLRAVGFERTGERMWQRGKQRIRWVRDREHIQGIEGEGRTFVAWVGCDHELEKEARIRRFTVSVSILHYAGITQ